MVITIITAIKKLITIKSDNCSCLAEAASDYQMRMLGTCSPMILYTDITAQIVIAHHSLRLKLSGNNLHKYTAIIFCHQIICTCSTALHYVSFLFQFKLTLYVTCSDTGVS